MDQTPISQPQTRANKTALLIDGENLCAARSKPIMDALRGVGALPIRRVYGDAAKVRSWEDVAGFRILHSGAGKNSADMLLAIEAMAMAFRGDVQHLIIASSDGDFSHLAHQLREMGLVVTGLGEARTPQRFQKACTRFIALPHDVATVPAKVAAPKADMDQNILNILKACGPKGLEIPHVNSEIRRRMPDFIMSNHPDRNWKAYFKNPARAKLFCVTGAGAACRVALAKP